MDIGIVIVAIALILVIWYVAKIDPIFIHAWYCNKCKKIVGQGSLRRAKQDRAEREHKQVSPTCKGILEVTEIERVPNIP